eukprot:TRINITY_DN669_c0_g1_i1.p1 TRINITY_DN669_c0_g1~~TRINITY_DN669_c0_g1_i1.p1  ORF type:complete len:605 (+),score=205.52 TRINITY_DN669_c0_g1_i1:195-1817(+)
MAKRWKLYLPFGYASLGGIIGSQTVLTAKSAAELIKVSFGGENQFIYAFTYVIIGIAAFTAVVQVHWINVGLKYFDALYIIPVFFVVWTVFSILGGNLYFDEFKTFSDLQATMFALGVSMTCIGVFLLSDRNDKSKEDAKDEIELMEGAGGSKSPMSPQEGQEGTEVRLNRSASLGKSLHVALDKPNNLSPLSPTASKEPNFQIMSLKNGDSDDDDETEGADEELQTSTMSLRQLQLEEESSKNGNNGVVKPMLHNVSVVETTKDGTDNSPGLSFGSTFDRRTISTDVVELIIRKYYPGFAFDPEEQPRFYKRKIPLSAQQQQQHDRNQTISPISPTPSELEECEVEEAEYFSVVEQRIQRFPPVSPEKKRITADYTGYDSFELQKETDDSLSRERARTLDELMRPAVKTSDLEADRLANQELMNIVDTVDSPNLPGKALFSHDTQSPANNNNSNHSKNNNNRTISVQRSKGVSDVELVQEPSPKGNNNTQHMDEADEQYLSDDETRASSKPSTIVPSPPHLASLAKPLNDGESSGSDGM